MEKWCINGETILVAKDGRYWRGIKVDAKDGRYWSGSKNDNGVRYQAGGDYPYQVGDALAVLSNRFPFVKPSTIDWTEDNITGYSARIEVDGWDYVIQAYVFPLFDSRETAIVYEYYSVDVDEEYIGYSQVFYHTINIAPIPDCHIAKTFYEYAITPFKDDDWCKAANEEDMAEFRENLKEQIDSTFEVYFPVTAQAN